MKKSLTILTGFGHDLAAGCWLATVLVIYRFHGYHTGRVELDALNLLEKEFFVLGLICVGIVLVTGMGRTFTYIEDFYGENAEKLRKKMLITKHMLLFGIFGTGTIWQYTMTFH